MIVIASFVAASGVARAQGAGFTERITPDQKTAAQKMLRNAASQAEAKQWPEAVELYQKVIDQFGDSVVKFPSEPGREDTQLYVDVRLYCQRRILELPAEGLKAYRDRVDARAGLWFKDAAEQRDQRLLRKIVDEAFASSWGDRAAELLGDLAFQEGRFADAIAAYRRIAPDDARSVGGLVYPDPKVSKAMVAAKKLLARAALGDAPVTAADLDRFAKEYPDAAGKLAGRNGPLETIVAKAIHDDHLEPAEDHDARWPTFAGSPTRTRIAPAPIDIGSRQWQVPLTSFSPRRAGFNPRMYVTVASGSDRRVPIHPIVLGDQVLVCDGRTVRAYNLSDRSADSNGQGPVDKVWEHDEFPSVGAPRATVAQMSTPQFTLTAYGDRVYARMEHPGDSQGMQNANGLTLATRIVALDRKAEGKLLWKLDSGEINLPQKQADGGRQTCGFEGAPVADAESVYVAITDGGFNGLPASYAACMSARSGAVKWVRYLFSSTLNGDNFQGRNNWRQPVAEIGHKLLSLDGDLLVYQSNSGAVAALDAQTGVIRWIAAYPVPDVNGMGSVRKRDLNPAVLHDGLVIVAPDDTPFVMAFDAATGRLTWRLDPQTDIVHLLGIAKGRLVATGDHVVTIDAATGKRLSKWPDNPAGFEGYGRGILAGESIYWPTRNEIHVLDQATGLRGNQPPIKLKETYQAGGGNLAAGDGYLVVAQAEALTVFCQNSRLIRRYRDQIARAPDQAVNHYHLARVTEAAGQDGDALEGLETAIAKARPGEMVDGRPLADAAREERYRVLVKLGNRAEDAADWPGAIARFERAAAAAPGNRDRLSALLRLADVQHKRGGDEEAVATLHELLAEPAIRALTLAADSGRVVRADLLIADKLGAIVRGREDKLYGPYEVRARDLLDRAVSAGDARAIEDVPRRFPITKAVPTAWKALGDLRMSEGRPREAALAYRRMLATARANPERAQALLAIADAYEASKLKRPARDAYARLAARFGSIELKTDGGSKTVDAIVRARLQRLSGDDPSADWGLSPPLARNWVKKWSAPARLMIAQGAATDREAGLPLVIAKGSIRPIDPVTGASPWTAEIKGEPRWAGKLGDKLIVQTESFLIGLNQADGTVAWRYEPLAQAGARRAANPFGGGAARANLPLPEDTDPPALHDPQIVGGRLYCLRGDKEILAFDGETGLLDWNHASTTKAINPNLLITEDRIVLQELSPNAIVIIDADTGRRLNDFSGGGDQAAWPRKPIAWDEDHIVAALDRLTVAMIDLKTGRSTWTFREIKVMPSRGPDRIFGDGERLFVLHEGAELIRLNPASGSKIWSQTLGADDLSERPDAFVLEGDRCYYTVGATPGSSVSSVNALAVDDGSLVWSHWLAGPRGGWSLNVVGGVVLVHPATRGSSDGSETDALPLSIHSAAGGELLQRLRFPALNCELEVAPMGRGLLVATADELWSLTERKVVDAAAPDR